MRFTSRRDVRRVLRLSVAASLLALVSACGEGDASTSATSTSESISTTTGPSTTGVDTSQPNGLQSSPSTTVTPTAAVNCVIHLHGKGGSGSGTTVSGRVTQLFPAGNGTGWGGRQWSYASTAEYAEARSVVANAASAAGCTRVVINGFSNGAAFAAKLYCRGESLDATLAGVVVDDPVPDHGTAGCAPAPGVDVALYWTGGLDDPAQPGWNCKEQDWTCEGGTTVGIDAYAAAMRTTVMASPHSSHQQYENPPEQAAWLGV